MMARILLSFLEFYRRWLSPAVHSLSAGGCRFQPTCSEYAMVAIATHGAWRGSALALWRLLRCHPFSSGGLDQVPTKQVPTKQVPTKQVPTKQLAPRQVPPAAVPAPIPHEPLP